MQRVAILFFPASCAHCLAYPPHLILASPAYEPLHSFSPGYVVFDRRCGGDPEEAFELALSTSSDEALQDGNHQISHISLDTEVRWQPVTFVT